MQKKIGKARVVGDNEDRGRAFRHRSKRRDRYLADAVQRDYDYHRKEDLVLRLFGALVQQREHKYGDAYHQRGNSEGKVQLSVLFH